MTFRQQLEQIRKQWEQILRDEAALQAERAAALAVLPARFGFGDLDDFIKAVTGACRKNDSSKVASVRRARRAARPAPAADSATKVEPRGLARAQAETVDEADPRPSAPAGASLDDPANFGLMPDFSLVASSGPLAPEQRERLAEAFGFATRVLHTSRIPAAVWREWRRFEKNAAELLRQ